MFDVCAGCERRGRAYEIFDWCANCERSLCPECMQAGCCERLPARSGQGTSRREEERWRQASLPLWEAPVPARAEELLPEHFGGRCCSRARAVECSCAFHWVCPSHGDHHIGTHD